MSDTSTIILALDARQNRPDANRCDRDANHGKLSVHGSGSALICGICGYNVPVAAALVAEALQAREWQPSAADISFLKEASRG